MFCPRCAFQLPDETKFCMQCGAPVTLPGATPKRLFCVECGSSYDSAWRFCNSCGNRLLAVDTDNTPLSPPLQSIPPASQLHTESAVQEAVSEEPVAADHLSERNDTPISAEPPLLEPVLGSAQTEFRVSVLDRPYARFAAITMALALILSVVTFCVADDLARKHSYFGLLIFLAVFAALIVVRQFRSTYGTLKRMAEGDGKIKSTFKSLCSCSFFFGAIFASTAGLVGFLIGTSGAETEKLIADYQTFDTLGSEISKLRNSADLTVPAQLAMYDELGTPLKKFREAGAQVKSELVPYDQKYPASHVATQKWMQDMDIAIRRADLIQKQIEAAKVIEDIDPRLQYDAWHNQMQPLLDEERNLAN